MFGLTKLESWWITKDDYKSLERVFNPGDAVVVFSGDTPITVSQGLIASHANPPADWSFREYPKGVVERVVMHMATGRQFCPDDAMCEEILKISNFWNYEAGRRWILGGTRLWI